MATIGKYNTYLDYENASGVYKILYPVRDSITIMNPFFVILMGFFLVAMVGSYYTYIALSGRARFFNCMLASGFATFVVSVFFAMGELIGPYTPLTFAAITIVSLSLAIFYK